MEMKQLENIISNEKSVDMSLTTKDISFLVCLLQDYIKTCDNYLNMRCLLQDEKLKCFNAKVKVIELRDCFVKSLESEE